MEKRCAMIAFLCVVLTGQATRAQVLSGDGQFEIVNRLQWGMTAKEVREICETRTTILVSTDSTLVFKMDPFGVEARAKVRFEKESQRLTAIDIAFAGSTSGIRDSLINHFVSTVGKRPLFTTKEKNFVIFTIRTEVASWIKGRDAIHVFSMMRGDELLGVSLLLSSLEKERKTN